jgi:acetoin utilization deacetylase AcuC-like enzyme
MNTGIVEDQRYLHHGSGFFGPESPERLASIYEMLDNTDTAWKLTGIDARHAEREELERVHLPSFVDYVARTAGSAMTMFDADTVVTADTYDAARLAAGGFMNAIDSVVAHETDNAFAFVRPPGHHARRGNAQGFCIFNNIAIGACHAMVRHGMERILIVDWDLHHGNGTQETFYEDSRVLYCSVHQSPAYPGTGRIDETGEGPGFGYTVNVPLPPGANDAVFIRVFKEIFRPVAREYRPEIILVSAGFDTYMGDPLGAMRMTAEGFAAETRILLDLAAECCNGRLVMVLEGGYHILGQVKSARAVLLEMLGETHMTEDTLNRMAADIDERYDRLIRRVREQIGLFWPVV